MGAGTKALLNVASERSKVSERRFMVATVGCCKVSVGFQFVGDGMQNRRKDRDTWYGAQMVQNEADALTSRFYQLLYSLACL